MYKIRLASVLFMLLLVTTAFATEMTSDGRPFDSLSLSDIEVLNESDKAAYQTWNVARGVEQSSSYQQSEGPSTMDISSDFSM